MEFEFIQNPLSKKWTVLAPRRANRPDVAKGAEPVCPFCPGREKDEPELYRVGGIPNDQNWQIRIVPNKFPFAPIHEIVIHSPDHHKNFGELPLSQVELILQTYRQRFITHRDKGQVYIFHNRGEQAGESLPHPHTQLAVIPFEVKMDIARLSSVFPLQNTQKTQTIGESDPSDNQNIRPASPKLQRGEQSGAPSIPSFLKVSTVHFEIFCPKTSQWPDEVWIAPKAVGRSYGEISNKEIADLAKVLTLLVQIFNLRHGNEFPFNFYIYPGGDWYLRFIPRVKILGGFEVGTGIFINTQNPEETIEFIKKHLGKTS